MILNYNDYGKDRIAEYLTALREPLKSQDVIDVLKVITPDLAHLYSHEWVTFAATEESRRGKNQDTAQGC